MRTCRHILDPYTVSAIFLNKLSHFGLSRSLILEVSHRLEEADDLMKAQNTGKSEILTNFVIFRDAMDPKRVYGPDTLLNL